MNMPSSIRPLSRLIIIPIAIAGFFLAGTLSAQVPARRDDVSRYSLILFDIDSPRLGTLNRRILQEYVLPDIAPGSQVSVVGYSDIIGNDDHDLLLSTQRAFGVARWMKEYAQASDGTVLNSQGMGRADAPYSNEYPEGRFYNRTVLVYVTPPPGQPGR
ncbi:MAG: hypothetical protein JWQ98_3566 [Chlorobi bacterium]|nr:hypothetical protein [Chlorobiota bacterium]